MPEFVVNTHRRQPYTGHRFRLVMEGRPVAGISSISALRRDTAVVTHRAGGVDPVAVRSPGLTTYEPVTLERGVTHDTAFEEWADLVHDPGADGATALAGYRRDLVLQLLNADGQVVLAYQLFGCWPSTYEALPTLDANGAPAVAIQRLVVQCERWRRDEAVGEPVERRGPASRRRGDAATDDDGDLTPPEGNPPADARPDETGAGGAPGARG